METVDFRVNNGDIVSVGADIVARNEVLRMVCRHCLQNSHSPVRVDDDPRTFQNLLSHLSGKEVDLSSTNVMGMIAQLRCAHKYQHYPFATEILKQLMLHCNTQTVLHLYTVFSCLPELPSIGDPTAPSAPPISDLRETDPEQAEFSRRLLHSYRQCLQMIDGRSAEVLSSDALLALPAHLLYQLGTRDSLTAREPVVAHAVLRWLRHHCLSAQLPHSERRYLLLNCVRFLLLSPREFKELQLDKCVLLSREETEVILKGVQKPGAIVAPPGSLAEYWELWKRPRGGRTSRRGLLQRLGSRVRASSDPGGRGEKQKFETVTPGDKRRNRADKFKMAIAIGASMLFD